MNNYKVTIKIGNSEYTDTISAKDKYCAAELLAEKVIKSISVSNKDCRSDRQRYDLFLKVGYTNV